MASTSNVSGSTGAADQSGQTILSAAGKELDKSTFLKLLVAQIKHQNPLNPADAVEFLSQLTQFSQLEQLMAIREGVDDLRREGAGATEGEEATAG